MESNKTFEDIANHWAKLYVESMVAKNVIHGYSDETFRPNDEITRAGIRRYDDQWLGNRISWI